MENDLPQPDERLWVRLRPEWAQPLDESTRWVICGNAHTHRGHFYVAALGDNASRTVRLDDVIDASEEARLWLDGFLAGQEPSRYEFMGADDDLYEAADAADDQRYEALRVHFRRTGWAPRLGQPPPVAPAASDVGPPQPWCWTAGLFRVLASDGWRPADPQPSCESWNVGFWPDTICADRSFHRLSVLDEHSGLLLCEDCHLIEAGQPDGEE